MWLFFYVVINLLKGNLSKYNEVWRGWFIDSFCGVLLLDVNELEFCLNIYMYFKNICLC